MIVPTEMLPMTAKWRIECGEREDAAAMSTSLVLNRSPRSETSSKIARRKSGGSRRAETRGSQGASAADMALKIEDLDHRVGEDHLLECPVDLTIRSWRPRWAR